MSKTLSQKRMAENEVVFRRYNEKVQQGFEEVKQLAEETNQEHLLHKEDTPLHFYCECSDENCSKRIMLSPNAYSKIHRDRSQFVVIRGHETNIIEEVIRYEGEYCVVRKFKKPPESVRLLQPTGVNNS